MEGVGFITNVAIVLSLKNDKLLNQFFILENGIPTYIFVQKLISPTISFPLLAVPFFIMTGVIMNYAGISKRIMNLADVLVGHFIGGFAQINILMSTMMGGMSASANADAEVPSCALTAVKTLVPVLIDVTFTISIEVAAAFDNVKYV